MSTPNERRNKIKERQRAGGFSNFTIISESLYQGYIHYKQGTDAGDAKIYAVEQALDRLEAANDA
jgi:hypothetical protein